MFQCLNVSQSKRAFYQSICHSDNNLRKPERMGLSRKFILLALLLSGQIEPNPGPKAKFPCGVCDRAVKNTDKGISCDHCSRWIHTNCVGMSDAAYNILCNQTSFSWICCHCALPNFSSTFFLSASSLETSNSYDLLDSGSSCSSNSVELGEDPGEPTASSTPQKDTPSLETNKSRGRNKPKKIKAMLINCNGLKGIEKHQKFEAELELHKPDIVFGCESKIDSSIPTYNIFPEDYSVLRNDRNAAGGGVFIATKNDIVTVERTEFISDCEITWISVEFARCGTLYLASFYRPSGYGSYKVELEQLQDSLGLIMKKHPHTLPNIIVAGDCNFPDIDWEQLCPTSSHHRAAHQSFIDLINEYCFSQLTNVITRPCSNSILDLVLTTNENLVSNLHTTTGISDHDIVHFNINVTPRPKCIQPRKVWNYKKADPEAVRNSLQGATEEFFATPPESRSVEQNWDFFKKSLFMAMDNIPHRFSKGKISHPWITPSIVRHMRKRDKLYNKACSSKAKHDWTNYTKQRNLVKRIMSKAHVNYINDVVGNSLSSDGKRFWTYIKSKRKESTGIPTLRTDKGVHFTNQAKANALNSQFSSVFTRDDEVQPPNKGPSPYLPINDLIIDEEGVLKQLEGLKINKASGPDEIPARMLHDYASNIAPMLTSLFQQSYNVGQLPSDWSKARVTGIYKKGDKTNPENFRPVSLTCICCKIQEHIILSHLAKHLSSQQIIIDNQHGFREKLSCETQLIQAVDDWAYVLNTHGQSDVLFLDFSKAFDKVSHKCLLHKLQYYGVSGKTNDWIKSFLTGRSQCVAVDGEESDWCPVVSGVPQGSVLGPVLFLLFINDITDEVTSTVRLFADDSMIYRNIKTPEDQILLHRDLLTVFNWAKTWGMSFNVKKCVHLTISNKRQPLTYVYTIDGDAIPHERSTKYLGVTISSDLSWTTHIEGIRAKASRTLGLIRRNLGPCAASVKEKAYQSLVRPQLEYASSVWNPYTKNDKTKVESIQRQAARFTVGDYRRTSSVTAMLDTLHWDTLEHRRLLAQATMFYKILNGTVNISIPQRFTPNPRLARGSHHLRYHQVITNLNSYKYSFYPRIIPLWNILPVEAVLAPSHQAFSVAALPIIRCLPPTASSYGW